MNRCKTCRHWKIPDNPQASKIAQPCDPDTGELMQMPYATRECAHPQLALFEHPPSNPGFALTDASEYYAALATTEDFGCVLHEMNPPSTATNV